MREHGTRGRAVQRREVMACHGRPRCGWGRRRPAAQAAGGWHPHAQRGRVQRAGCSGTPRRRPEARAPRSAAEAAAAAAAIGAGTAPTGAGSRPRRTLEVTLGSLARAAVAPRARTARRSVARMAAPALLRSNGGQCGEAVGAAGVQQPPRFRSTNSTLGHKSAQLAPSRPIPCASCRPAHPQRIPHSPGAATALPQPCPQRRAASLGAPPRPPHPTPLVLDDRKRAAPAAAGALGARPGMAPPRPRAQARRGPRPVLQPPTVLSNLQVRPPRQAAPQLPACARGCACSLAAPAHPPPPPTLHCRACCCTARPPCRSIPTLIAPPRAARASPWPTSGESLLPGAIAARQLHAPAAVSRYRRRRPPAAPAESS